MTTAAVPIDDMPTEARAVLVHSFEWLADDVGPLVGAVLLNWCDDLERRRPALGVAALRGLGAADVAELLRTLRGSRFARRVTGLVASVAASPYGPDILAVALALRDAIGRLDGLVDAEVERATLEGSES